VVAGESRHHVQLSEREVDGTPRPLIDRLEREA
jgi:hypothetical protein